jgi:hypothetical protein
MGRLSRLYTRQDRRLERNLHFSHRFVARHVSGVASALPSARLVARSADSSCSHSQTITLESARKYPVRLNFLKIVVPFSK